MNSNRAPIAKANHILYQNTPVLTVPQNSNGSFTGNQRLAQPNQVQNMNLSVHQYLCQQQPQPQIAHHNIRRQSRKAPRERYSTLKQVGQGTFADIWEVYSTDVDVGGQSGQMQSTRHFAMKALRKGKCVGADGNLSASKYSRYSKAIVAEGRRITRLNALDPQRRAQIVHCREILLPRDVSPNLAAAVTGGGGSDGKNPIGPCVVMELLGVSLIHFEHLRKHKKVSISLQTVRFIALQLLNAMSFLHGVGHYIHADLKPENVVISLEHSVGDELLTQTHPNIKVIDLGNALAMNRQVSTFEVQSLHYRAPELIFGNEVTAAIDLWSVGCILLELTSDHEYGRALEAAKRKALRKAQSTASNSTSNSNSNSNINAMCHYAVFASRNNAQLASRITSVFSSFPAYFYNEFDSFHWTQMSTTQSIYADDDHTNPLTHCDSDYTRQRLARRQRLVQRMRPDATTMAKLERDTEFVDFLDLMARLLDPNPSTRLTSEDATQHRFCIGADYVRNDARLQRMLTDNFDSVFPRISISTDADRQRRIDAQYQRYQRRCAAAVRGEKVPRPSGKAMTRRTSHGDAQCSDATVRHSRAVCLMRGCCGNETLLPIDGQRRAPNAVCLLGGARDLNDMGFSSEVLERKSTTRSPASPSPALRPTQPPPNKRVKLYHHHNEQTRTMPQGQYGQGQYGQGQQHF